MPLPRRRQRVPISTYDRELLQPVNDRRLVLADGGRDLRVMTRIGLFRKYMIFLFHERLTFLCGPSFSERGL